MSERPTALERYSWSDTLTARELGREWRKLRINSLIIGGTILLLIVGGVIVLALFVFMM